jgi:hypothetical protein
VLVACFINQGYGQSLGFAVTPRFYSLLCFLLLVHPPAMYYDSYANHCSGVLNRQRFFVFLDMAVLMPYYAEVRMDVL